MIDCKHEWSENNPRQCIKCGVIHPDDAFIYFQGYIENNPKDEMLDEDENNNN